MRAAVAIVAVISATAAAGEISLTLDGPAPSFNASPVEGEQLMPAAARLKVVCTDSRWSIRVRAAGPLASRLHPEQQLPPARLRISASGAVDRAALSEEEQLLLADQPPTGPEGRWVSLDYGFRTEWGDAPLPGDDAYQTRLVFSVLGVEGDTAIVSPSPFSPDGDGVKDLARLLLRSGEARTIAVLDANGDRIRALAASEGWDGRTEAGAPAPEGEYRLVALGAGGEVLDGAPVSLQRGAAVGLRRITGHVRDRDGRGLEGAKVELRADSGILQGEVATTADGAFAFEGVAPGTYVLRAHRDLYFELTSPAFDVTATADVVQDLVLIHNHSLIVGLTAGAKIASVGRLVPFDAQVRAVGTTAVDDVRLSLVFGAGLTPIPGSVEVDDVRLATAELAALSLGHLAIGQQKTVRVWALLGAGGAPREATAEVTGVAAGEAARAGPVAASVRAAPGELTGRGGIYGRICWDTDGDGRCAAAEPAAPFAAVFLEEGSFAQADRAGRFHFSPLPPGRHVVLAGPGPLALSPRGGGLPALPRQGARHQVVRVPAGQYIALDLALPPPPGYAPESAPAAPLDPDEGDLLPSALPPKIAFVAEETEEGSLDASGRIVGVDGTLRPVTSAAQLSATPPTAPQPDRTAPDAPVALAPLEPTGAGPSTAYVGLGEATLNVDASAETFRLLPTGRLALTVQHDFGSLARASLVVDTARATRSELLAGLDVQGTMSELGDDARVAMSAQEKLYLRLDLRWLHAEAGRLSASLQENPLLYFERSMVGAEVAVGNRLAEARVFGGFASEVEVVDTLPGQDATGPYLLTRTPILPGSERVDVEVRAGAELRGRVRLQRGVDYFLDPLRGTVDLARPLFARTASGDESFLVVRYQVVTDAPLFAGAVGGVRATLGEKGRRLGLSALFQGRPGDDALVAVAADGELVVGPAKLAVEGGVLPLAQEPLADRSAGRARLTVTPLPGVEAFGFGAYNGSAWEPTIRSQSPSAQLGSELSLLDSFVGPSPLSYALGLAAEGNGAFPFQLAERPGALDFGGGTRVREGPVSAIALARRTALAGAPTTDHAELAAVADLGGARLYAGHSTAAGADELLGRPNTQARERHSVAGAETTVFSTALAADFRDSLTEEAGVAPREDRAVFLRGRFQRYALLQPAAMVSYHWTTQGGVDTAHREVAAGLEASPSADFRAFVYARASDEGRTALALTQGVFAGVLMGNAERRLQLRYDLSAGVAGPVHRLSWNARAALPFDTVASSDGQLELPTGLRLLRLGLALRPLASVQVLLRGHEEQTATTLTRLASTDVSVRVHPRVRTDLKYLFRWERTAGLRSVAGLAGASATLSLPAKLDLVLGARQLRDAAGSAYGAEVEVGYTLLDVLRVGVGLNLATRGEVFSIAGQAPGLHLTITAADAGVLQHRTPKAAAPLAVETLAVAPVPAPEAVATTPSPAPVEPAQVRISGRLFGDRNQNGAFDSGEPVFEGVPVIAGDAEATTDKEGRYSAETVAGGEVSVAVKDAAKLPFTHLPAVARAARRATEVDVVIDLLAPKPSLAAEGPFELPTAAGPRKVTPVERATFPLAAWIAGLPLSAQESATLQRLANAALESPDLMLVVLARAQSTGPLHGAVKRAWRGGQALKRYLQATQMVPPKRIAIGVLEPDPAVAAPAGNIELLLVRVGG